MISPISSQAVADLAAAAGVGAVAAQAVAAKPKTRGTSVLTRPAEALARQLGAPARPGGIVAAPRTRTPTPSLRLVVPGYATATPSAELAFLKDPRLSLEDKLMRLLSHLSKKADAEVQKKIEELGGATTQAAAKKTKGGIVGQLTGGGIGGFLGDLLKAPGVRTALGKLGGPIVAAATAALGPAIGPVVGPVLAKAAPTLISGLVSAASNAASQPATGSAALSEKDKEFKLMELQRVRDHQNEMFRLISSIIRQSHETRLGVIGNIR